MKVSFFLDADGRTLVKTLKRTYSMVPFGCPATNDLEIAEGDRQMISYKNRAGRPPKKRRHQSHYENKGAKPRPQKCGLCKETGHNRSACELRKLEINNERATKPCRKRCRDE